MKYDTPLGGPYERGAADAYYRRPYNPHCYVGANYSAPLIEADGMSVDELEAYDSGYKDQVKVLHFLYLSE